MGYDILAIAQRLVSSYARVEGCRPYPPPDYVIARETPRDAFGRPGRRLKAELTAAVNTEWLRVGVPAQEAYDTRAAKQQKIAATQRSSTAELVRRLGTAGHFQEGDMVQPLWVADTGECVGLYRKRPGYPTIFLSARGV